MEVVGHKAHGAVPQPGSVVIARVRSLSLREPLIGASFHSPNPLVPAYTSNDWSCLKSCFVLVWLLRSLHMWFAVNLFFVNSWNTRTQPHSWCA
jgi:hypothetical protein